MLKYKLVFSIWEYYLRFYSYDEGYGILGLTMVEGRNWYGISRLTIIEGRNWYGISRLTIRLCLTFLNLAYLFIKIYQFVIFCLILAIRTEGLYVYTNITWI